MDTPDRQLRYFVRIAELKSLSRAAEDLDQTQSGLSRQLAALEAHVGKPLFVRTGRGVELTEAGARLLQGIQPAYRAIDQALEAVRQREGVTQGSVRLATVHTLSYYFMADVVAQFVSSREHVNLSVMGRSSPEVVTLVESGKADIGFVYDAAVASDALASTPLFDDDMCLIVRDGVAAEDGVDLGAMALRLVGFPSHYALRKMIHSAGLQPEFVAEAETIDAMLKLVSSGVGACILPSRIPQKLLTDYGLRQVAIGSPVLRRRVVAITLAQRQPLPLVRELLDCARRIARG
ncbi:MULTISPECIES: LysR family transcriptional regulator [Achromobacter]|jgi:DNA-binding transcriptional LysR family regulator|uniref:HTH-type transcriptional regulator CynR n=2 Tax=Achromobacter TaxID=222 RepID=A0A848NKM6_9BURK|nr:LysR family transcriptional regulator [Achromobacter ruhlandii]AKP91078.1 transcriptional regulator, LysR-family [Achromobacter xylosoxidans]AMG47192.1 LysR family transcriptional regulator [Achromobacter xylosoxidans]AOU94297.1 LysR family transcriptional regulator [Achromobacter ruhlandii]MCI1839467.1 LysR family transcriptional regulator [Achromobacter ruhlandii]MCZ8396088.1 LysR family transcriptional regulator [Achromobacter ruhlandii]